MKRRHLDRIELDASGEIKLQRHDVNATDEGRRG
jgi:hypothetical protein